MNNFKLARNILETSMDACDETTQDYTFDELKDLMSGIISELESGETDFCIDDLACGEVRVISGSVIDELWTESLIDEIKECYDLSSLDELPPFIAVSVDWEQTAENAKQDGLGPHFAGYDHEEHNTSGYHIFRTN